MSHLFISYSRQDSNIVNQLTHRLEQSNYEIWIDRKKIQVGDQFQSRISRAIRKCDALIVVLSKKSIWSAYVRDELTLAKKHKKHIIPVSIQQNIKIPDHLELQLAGIHIINISMDFDIGIGAVINSLNILNFPQLPSKKIVCTDICPYKGLEYFDYNDEDPNYFFGRETLVQKLLDHVKNNNFLALVGASGNGKSSVLRAGLLHQLKLGRYVAGSDQWQARIIRPDQQPIHNLAIAFINKEKTDIEQAIELEKIINLLQDKKTGLKRLVQVAFASRLILVIDQFEEIFTRCSSQGEREHFIACLLEALSVKNSKLCLIISMRSDFIVKCHEHHYSGLNQWLERHMISVLPMEIDELKSAISKPAAQVGLEVESSLIAAILSDIEGAPGSLPLLQYTLKTLWQKRNGNKLVLPAYQEMGGIKGALDKRATKIYNSFDKAEQLTVQHIFLQLTQLGEGAEDTRRRVFRVDLVSEPKHTEIQVNRVLTRLSSPENRLVVTSEKVIQGEKLIRMAIVDVAHEALIRNWKLLRNWIDRERDLLRHQRFIESSAITWREQGESAGYLLQGGQLIEARKIQKKQDSIYSFSDTAKIFIKRSLRQKKWQQIHWLSWITTFIILTTGSVSIFENTLLNFDRAEGVTRDQAFPISSLESSLIRFALVLARSEPEKLENDQMNILILITKIDKDIKGLNQEGTERSEIIDQKIIISKIQRDWQKTRNNLKIIFTSENNPSSTELSSIKYKLIADIEDIIITVNKLSYRLESWQYDTNRLRAQQSSQQGIALLFFLILTPFTVFLLSQIDSRLIHRSVKRLN